MANRQQSFGGLCGKLAYLAFHYGTLLLAAVFFAAAVVHISYTFLLPQYYVNMHGGDPSAARSVSVVAVPILWGIAEIIGRWGVRWHQRLVAGHA